MDYDKKADLESDFSRGRFTSCIEDGGHVHTVKLRMIGHLEHGMDGAQLRGDVGRIAVWKVENSVRSAELGGENIIRY